MSKRVNILEVTVDNIDTKSLIAKLLEWSKNGNRKTVTYINAHCVNIAVRDKDYKVILKGMDLVYPDGMGVVWASKILNCPLSERTNTMDFFEDFIKKAKDTGLSFYFLGAKKQVLKQMIKKLRDCYGIKIAGYHNGYFDHKQEEQIIEEINNLRPNILMVGMDAPRQEKWIAVNLNKLDVNLCWAVGGAFGILAGVLSRSPRWIRTIGLEWFFRLCQEPRRLWRRYLIGNPVFIYRVFRERLRLIFNS